MGAVRQITITPGQARVGAATAAARHLTFWAILFLPIAASRMLFGGAFVIDLVALLMTCLYVFHGITRRAGWSVEMTREEVRAWVAGGMPDDVKSWKEGRNG